MIRTVARTYRAAYSGLPRDLWLLSLVLLVNRAGSMVLPFIAIYLTQERGLSVIDAGRILAIYGVGAIVGSYLGGWSSDRIGPTRTQHVTLIASGVLYLWVSVLSSYAWIVAGFFLLSIAVEAFRPAVMADTAQRSPAAVQVRAFALLRLAANVGVGIGPAVGGFLALYSYRWLFVADAVTCVAASAVLALALEAAPIAAAGNDASDTPPPRSPWRDGPFLLLMLWMVVLASAFFQVFSTLPLYFRRVYGFREDTIGLLLAVNPLLIVLFEMVLIHWAEKRHRTLLIGLGAFLTCGGLALMPLGHSILFVVFTISVWTLGEMLALPLANALVAERAGEGSRGRYMGMYTMTFAVAFVFAPALGTWVFERLGPDLLWYGVGLLGLVTGGWALALTPAFRRRSV